MSHFEMKPVQRALSAPAALAGGLLSLGLSAAMLAWQAGGRDRNIAAPLFFLAWSLVFLAIVSTQLFCASRVQDESSNPAPLRSMAPPLFAGGVIGACLTLTSDQAFVPVLFWLVFYGLALLSTIHFAPPSIVALGWAFLMTGLAAFIYFMNITLLPFSDLPTPTRFYPAAIMGGTFGLYHLIYAVCAWPRRHGCA